MREFNSKDDLIYNVFVEKHLYTGSFCYVINYNDKQLHQWLKQNGFKMEVKENKFLLYEI